MGAIELPDEILAEKSPDEDGDYYLSLAELPELRRYRALAIAISFQKLTGAPAIWFAKNIERFLATGRTPSVSNAEIVHFKKGAK